MDGNAWEKSKKTSIVSRPSSAYTVWSYLIRRWELLWYCDYDGKRTGIYEGGYECEGNDKPVGMQFSLIISTQHRVYWWVLSQLRVWSLGNKRHKSPPSLTNTDTGKETFYSKLNNIARVIPKRESLAVLGDSKARVRRDSTTWNGVTDEQRLRNMNTSVELLLISCPT